LFSNVVGLSWFPKLHEAVKPIYNVSLQPSPALQTTFLTSET
jgi:hypothetical protein